MPKRELEAYTYTNNHLSVYRATMYFSL